MASKFFLATILAFYRRKILFSTLAALICTAPCYTQFPAKSLGIIAGYSNSSISNLDHTTLSETYFRDYNLSTISRSSFSFGIYYDQTLSPGNIQIAENNYTSSALRRLSFHGELAFANQGSRLLMNNYLNDFNYTLDFRYNFINVFTGLHFYPRGGSDNTNSKMTNTLMGLYAGAGLQLGFNFTPNSISYHSWGKGALPVFGTDEAEQQKVSSVIKGKNSYGIALSVGYDFITAHGTPYRNYGISLEARLFLGVNDMVETKPNPYNFVENSNRNKVLQILLIVNPSIIFQ